MLARNETMALHPKATRDAQQLAGDPARVVESWERNSGRNVFRRSGALAILLKPLDPAEILRAIDQALGSRPNSAGI